MSILSETLASMGACDTARDWAKNHKTIQAAWNACDNPEWLIWVLVELKVSDSALRKLACQFVRETPLADGRKVWDLLADERSKNAVVIAESFSDGNATIEELDAARDAAWSAAYAARGAAWSAADAARGAACAAYAARGAAWSAADAARGAACAAQCNIIRKMFPKPPLKKKAAKKAS